MDDTMVDPQVAALEDQLALAAHEGRAEDFDRIEREMRDLARAKAHQAAALRGAELAEQKRLAVERARAKQEARQAVAAARRELRKLVPGLDKNARAFVNDLVKAAGAYARANGGDFKSDVLFGVFREALRSVPPRDIFEERAVRSLNIAAGSDGFRHPPTYAEFFEHLTNLAEV